MGDVRTVCLLGHSGVGKTALTEAIMAAYGGSGQLDATPEAKARGSSVDLNAATVERDDDRLVLLDAPGFNEFIEETYKGLNVAEAAVLTVHAERGLEVQTEVDWDLIRRFGTPAVVAVHQMDADNADFSRVVSELRESLTGNLAPIQWPIQDENRQFAGVVDLVAQQAHYFNGEVGEIPSELADEVASGREALLEGLAEVDDELMEHFLEEADIPQSEVAAALKTAIAEQAVVPIVATSIRSADLVGQLVDLLVEETPAFAETREPDAEPTALVFNAHSDPYIGAMAYAKVYGGPLAAGTSLCNLRTGQTESIREILRPRGDSPDKAEDAEAGEVVVLTKLRDFELGDTLTAGQREPLDLAELPSPVFPRAVEPVSEGDEEKMSSALRQLVQTKASLSLRHDEVTHETILAGMGDTQLEVMTRRLENRFGTSVTLSRPSVPYKETIMAQAEGQYRHKKQSGGRGQYGEVYLRIEPLERGAGFEFVDEIKGGVIPNQFIPAVQKGIEETMAEGILHGYPMTDVRAAAYYGSHHEVDSSEMAFKIAASQAFQAAVHNDNPVLMEPVMELTVRSPQAYTGDIMGNLSGKRGRVHGMEPQDDGTGIIKAEVPLAEVQDYALELKSITQGRAMFSLEFAHYEPVASPQLAEELLERERRNSGEGAA